VTATTGALSLDDRDRRWLEHLLATVDALIAERRAGDAQRHLHLIENLERLRRRLAAKLRDST
jgi:hypothetical protein